jgi:site-specific DNA recombinase
MLKAVRGQARADAERAIGAQERVGPVVIPRSIKTFAREARKRLRCDGVGYRRNYLRVLAQRVDVDLRELRIVGTKSKLPRTLIAALGAKTVGFSVPRSVPKWRPRRDSNPCYRRERAMS